jgi:hypothetical protein
MPTEVAARFKCQEQRCISNQDRKCHAVSYSRCPKYPILKSSFKPSLRCPAEEFVPALGKLPDYSFSSVARFNAANNRAKSGS